MEKKNLMVRLLAWRAKYISDKAFIIFLSIVTGLAVGLAAVIIKQTVNYTETFLHHYFPKTDYRFLYLVFPGIGILLAILFIKFVIKRPVRHGIPNVLYSISKTQGYIRRHNLFSSIITSTLTVGFGGSVGLEGPTVATGAAIGSNLGRLMKLEYKQVVLLLGCACTGAMAAIFKAPIAAIVFALEVIMLDLTMASLVPLLIASVTAYLTSYKLLGPTVLYPFEIAESFHFEDFPYYIVLGIVTGLVSVYFTRMYMFVTRMFEKVKNQYYRFLIGAASLGVLIFFFPALYGEGYEFTNFSLKAEHSIFFNDTLYEGLAGNELAVIGILLAIIFFKVIATSSTFASGGVGGIFAPTLFMGAVTGLIFAKSLNYFHIALPTGNFSLAGMGGLIAGVIHAPLTAIFLIAEITSGYELFVPLMIVATISFATTRIFVTNSVYTLELAKRGELITHHKDKAMFMLMNLDELIEKNFVKVNPDNTLGELVKAVAKSTRNVFPVVDNDNNMVGILTLNDIRDIMFETEKYDKVQVKGLMYFPSTYVSYYDTLEEIAEKIESSGRYNVPVLKDGKYLGFVSRAKIFSSYRKMLKDFSED